MALKIDMAGCIIIDNHSTGLKLGQREHGSIVYTPQGVQQKYKEHHMPYKRYSAAHDEPCKVGAQYDPNVTAGRAQLEVDVRALLERLA